MMKIAVCDDKEQVCVELMDIIKAFFEGRNRQIQVIKFTDGLKLLESKICFDIVFLDIVMPGMNGLEIAKNLRNRNACSKIIYVTDYGKYKGDAYKVHAFDYIVKPVSKPNVFRTLQDVVLYIENASKKHILAFTTEDGIVYMDPDDIYYFEYVSRKVIINTTQGQYVARYTLKELQEKFSKYNFASPHKSFIVNMLYIKNIKQFDIFMENGKVLPLAQKQAVGFKKKFNRFLQRTFDKI